MKLYLLFMFTLFGLVVSRYLIFRPIGLRYEPIEKMELVIASLIFLWTMYLLVSI